MSKWTAMTIDKYWSSWSSRQPIIHAVLEDWGGKTLCGVMLTDYGWKTVDGEINCGNCLRVTQGPLNGMNDE